MEMTSVDLANRESTHVLRDRLYVDGPLFEPSFVFLSAESVTSVSLESRIDPSGHALPSHDFVIHDLPCIPPVCHSK